MPHCNVADRRRKTPKKLLRHLFLDKDYLERGAALAVERQAPRQAFFDRQVEIGIGQDDGRIFGLQPEYGTKPMQFRVPLLKRICRPAGTDERQHFTWPLAISGGVTFRPSPKIMLITPGGNDSRNAFMSGLKRRTPWRGGFITTVFPMIRAGIRVVNVSFNG